MVDWSVNSYSLNQISIEFTFLDTRKASRHMTKENKKVSLDFWTTEKVCHAGKNEQILTIKLVTSSKPQDCPRQARFCPANL